MKKGILYAAHPSRKLFATLLIIVASWIAFQLVGIVSGIFIFNLSIQDIANALGTLGDNRIIGFLKYVQAFTSTGMFVFAGIFSAWIMDPDWKGFLSLREKPGLLISLLSVIFIILILPFTNLLTYYNANMEFPSFLEGLGEYFKSKEDQMTDIMKSFLRPGAGGGLFVNLLVIAIIPAFGEELIFRGVLQRLFQKWFASPHWAIFVTAFLFSAVHFQFLSFLPRFFLGIVLGYLFYWSGSIWLTIIVHFINNSLAVVFYYFFYGGKISNYLENAGTPGNDNFFAIFSVIIGSGLLFLIYKKRRQPRSEFLN